MQHKEEKIVTREWREIDQILYDWGGFCVYDNPYSAYLYESLLSPCKLSQEDWKKWAHVHYVGNSGYDHETGRITNEVQRKFFDMWYPNWKAKAPDDDDEDFGCDEDWPLRFESAI